MSGGLDVVSPANPHVKALVRLRKRRERERTGRTLVEGARELRRAVEEGVAVDEVLLAPGLAGPAAIDVAVAAAARGARALRVSDAVFTKLSLRRHPDGVCGVVALPGVLLEALELPDPALVLVVDGVEKPGNLGAMLRTAEATDSAVIVADDGTDPGNPQVVRASQGSVFAVPLASAAPEETAAWLRARGVRIVAAEPSATVTLWEADLGGPLAVVVGSEHRGLDATWRQAATPVRIPMRGHVDSLNASVAAAVLLYEAVRRRST